MLNVLGDCSCSSQSPSLYPLCYYTLLAPKSLKRQTLPFVSLFNSDRGVWYQQSLSIFFFFLSNKGNVFERQNLKKGLLLSLFCYGSYYYYFSRGFLNYYAQTKLPRENLSNSLRTADESNGLLKDFIYIIEHRENRESQTDMLTY